jgi:hypothetical protein
VSNEMSADQNTYMLPANSTPFSITRGGFANFSCKIIVEGDVTENQPSAQITWLLRDNTTDQVFSARQDISSDHAALYSHLVCERPLVENRVYETLAVSASKIQNDTVKAATVLPAKVENRMGVARGTHIITSRGEVAVENLAVGDRVITRDHGMQVIRWIGSERVRVSKDNAPILIRKGAFKNARDLVVSADHRMVLKGAEAILAYGVKEVLIPARNLINGDTIVQAVSGEVEFFQILTDQHEVIYAEAAAIESFLPTQDCLNQLNQSNQRQIFDAFPILAVAPNTYGPSARGFVDAKLA